MKMSSTPTEGGGLGAHIKEWMQGSEELSATERAFIRKGEKIYWSEIRHRLPTIGSPFIVIEVQSHDYYIGDDPQQAFEKACQEHPNTEFYFRDRRE